MATETPGMVCGPTTGCGQATPMVPTLVHTTGGVENGWQVPAACMHCGKPFSGSARIDNPPPIAALAPWFVFGASRSSGEPSAIPEEPIDLASYPATEQAERLVEAIEWAHREGETTSMAIREHHISTLDLKEILKSRVALIRENAQLRALSGGIPRSLSEEPFGVLGQCMHFADDVQCDRAAKNGRGTPQVVLKYCDEHVRVFDDRHRAALDRFAPSSERAVSEEPEHSSASPLSEEERAHVELMRTYPTAYIDAKSDVAELVAIIDRLSRSSGDGSEEGKR